MKKTLQKVTAFALATALLLTNFTNIFAATTMDEKLDKLVGMEVIKGTGNGVDGTSTMVRYRSFVMMLRLKGLENDMLAYDYQGQETFTDSEGTSEYVARLMAYFKAHPELGVIGYPDGSFQPYKEISAKEHAKIMLTVLGYEDGSDFTWDTVSQKALVANLVSSMSEVDDDDNFTVSDLANFTYNALATEPKGGTTTLGEDLGFDVVEEEVVVPAELMVESVTSTNLKTITVKFNKEVDKDSAETIANYDVVGTASLAADNMTVTLELTTAANQQDEVTLTIKDVKDADGTKIAEVEKKIGMFDATVPVATGITLTGPKSFEIMFSESMKTVGTVKVNNGIYAATPSLDGTKVKVALGTALTEGDYTVEVSGSTDHADFAIKTTELTLNYVKDTSDVTVSVDKAGQTSVTIKFSADVNLKDFVLADFYHSYTGYMPANVYKADGVTDAIAVVADEYADTLVLDFSTYPLPAGNVTVTVSDDHVADAWGNKMAADAKLPVTVEADTTAPSITKAEATDEDTLVVTFSEDVTPGTLADNFVIKDASGDTVSQTYTGGSAYANNAQTLELSSKLDGGTYTITVKDVADKALSPNKISEVAIAFEVSDKTPATISSAIVVEAADEVVDTTDDAYVYITFSENMTVTDITNLNNYQLDNAAMPTGSKVELFGSNKKVKLTIPDTTTLVGNTRLEIGQMADASGNKITAFSTLLNVVADVAPIVTAIKSTDLNVVEITVNGILVDVPAAGITIDADGAGGATAIAAASYVANETDNETVITATLDATDVLADKASTVTAVNIVASKIKSQTGKYMDAVDAVVDADAVTALAQPVVPTEAITPEFDAPADTTATAAAVADSGADNVITLTFDETAIDVANALSVSDITVVYDGTTKVAGTDYTVANAGGDATLELTVKNVTAGKSIVVSVAGANYIVDANGNAIADFSHTYTAK